METIWRPITYHAQRRRLYSPAFYQAGRPLPDIPGIYQILISPLFRPEEQTLSRTWRCTRGRVTEWGACA